MRRMILATSTLVGVVMLTSVASAYDGDWKRGRVYYQGVCTPCHKATANPEGIPANNYTIAEWTSYLAADKHAAGSKPGNKRANPLNRYAVPVPRAISVNMLRLRLTREFQPR